MMHDEQIEDHDAELSVLGAIALSERSVPILLEAGLRPGHFNRADHGEAFRSALLLHDKGEAVDVVTCPELAEYAAAVPALGNLRSYARAVLDKARWREIRRAGLTLLDAAGAEDEDAVATAERLLATPEEGATGVYTRERLGDLMWDRLQNRVEPGWTYPLLRNVTLRRRTVHLWGAHTSHGKSVWVDQVARHLYAQKAKVWAWINEMTAEERMCRLASATTGIALERVESNELSDKEKGEVAKAMNFIPWEIRECAGWSVEQLTRDIRVRKPDVAIIDILHEVPYRDERDLGHIMQRLSIEAKLSDCAIIATVHLNRNRTIAAARPRPTLADIKGSSSFEQRADVMGMIWREDDEETGRPTNVGEIYTLKVRQWGRVEGIPVLFDGEHAEFDRRLADVLAA